MPAGESAHTDDRVIGVISDFEGVGQIAVVKGLVDVFGPGLRQHRGRIIQALDMSVTLFMPDAAHDTGAAAGIHWMRTLNAIASFDFSTDGV